MSQFQGSSRVENMVSNILDNGLLTTNRYVAEIIVPRSMRGDSSQIPNLMIRCSNVTLPGKNINTINYRLYGPTRSMPYEILYDGNITLTYILSRDMNERAFFEKWMNSVVSNRDYKVGFYDDYIGSLAIHVLDRSDQTAYVSLVEEIFPKTIGEISLANDRENDYMIQEVTFGYRKYTSNFFTRQFPEQPGGDMSKIYAGEKPPKNNGNGLGIASFFNGVGKKLFG